MWSREKAALDIIDQLTDVVGATALGALDDFSDTLHDEIIVQSRAAGLTVELLDAKGDVPPRRMVAVVLSCPLGAKKKRKAGRWITISLYFSKF